MKNSASSSLKHSSNDKLMGKQILFIVIVELIICLLASLFYTIKSKIDHLKQIKLLEDDYEKNDAINFFTLLGTWFLILSNMVPISLLVTIEIIKFIQGWFINNDNKLYDKDQNKRTNVNTSGLNEELGQINAVFSDKTGTLTRNEMNFKKICILGKNYGIDKPNSINKD